MFALRHLFTHYYVILIFQIDDGRQMVTVTVQPSPAPMRTQGGTFVFAILLIAIAFDIGFGNVVGEWIQPFEHGVHTLAHEFAGIEHIHVVLVDFFVGVGENFEVFRDIKVITAGLLSFGWLGHQYSREEHQKEGKKPVHSLGMR